MPGHLLGVLQPPVVFQVNRDAGCPPGVTSDWGEKTRRLGPLPNRSPGVVSVKSLSRHCRSKRINALEQGLPALEACGDNVLVQNLLEQMMHWHLVFLATFFVESQPTAGPHHAETESTQDDQFHVLIINGLTRIPGHRNGRFPRKSLVAVRQV